MLGNLESAPEFRNSHTDIEAIRGAARHLESVEKIAFAFQASEIQKFGNSEEVKAALRISNFSLDRQRWWEFARMGSTKKRVGRNLDALPVAWLWLHAVFPNVFERFACSTEPSLLTRNPIAAAYHEWLTPNQPFMDSQLDLLAGRYTAFRPHFLDPDKIMAMTLTCGIESDSSRFVLQMTYPRPGWKKQVNESVEGFMVPYHDCILFQGTIGKPRAPFIFILTDLRPGPDGHYERGEGALLVGAGGTLPNSAPMAIWRTELEVKPHVKPKATIGSSLDYWRYIEAIFERGVVEGGSRRPAAAARPTD